MNLGEAGAYTGGATAKRTYGSAYAAMLAFAIVVLGIGSALSESMPPATLEARLASPPSDLTFDAQGTMYVASAIDNAMYRIGAEGSELVATYPGVFGIASVPGAGVCAGHLTEAEPPLRASRLSCLRDGAWSTRLENVGNGVHGLAGSPEGLWIAAWLATDVESRNGLVVLTNDSGIVHETRLRELVPQFVTPRPGGGALVSAWREDAEGFREGAIFAVSERGFEIWTDRPHRPTGILVTDQGVWVADRTRETLSLFTPEGALVRVVDGFVTPMGLARSAELGVCVAEEDARRIRCFDPASSTGGAP